MKKFITALFIFISVSGYSIDEKQVNEWKRTTWRLNILLKSEKVRGGAVQFAIIESDPREAFKKDYKKLKDRSIEEKRYDADTELSLAFVAWDIQFRGVNGDEVYLLLKGDMNGFSSNKPDKRYYLVTKAALVNEKPCVWFIPLKVKTGNEQDVTLSDSNVIYLQDLVK
ncbi:MAG TPA: hypothetical protein PKZ64_19025 [Spirochaetota bacterium]|nr:hypothetical protein [Spirochaetota bacterium]